MTDDISDSPPRDRLGRVEHDWTTFESPSAAVVRATAAATNREITAIPPLQESIETDSLDAMFDGGTDREHLRVSFSYAGVRIVIDASGALEVILGDRRWR